MKYTEFKKLKIKHDKTNTIKFKEKNTVKVKDERSKLNNDGIYEVYPIAITEKQLYIICPFCGDIHVHGLVIDADGSFGGRSPFCLNGKKNNSTYYIRRD